MKTVTEQDFRKPEFIDAKVEDYEFRHDGKLVRKDRWETAVRSIASALGCTDWEVEDVVRAANSAVTQGDLTVVLNAAEGYEVTIGRVIGNNDFFIRSRNNAVHGSTVADAIREYIIEAQL